MVVHALRIHRGLRHAPKGNGQAHHGRTARLVEQGGIPGYNAAPVMADKGEFIIAQGRGDAGHIGGQGCEYYNPRRWGGHSLPP